jgi:hypothetical protein
VFAEQKSSVKEKKNVFSEQTHIYEEQRVVARERTISSLGDDARLPGAVLQLQRADGRVRGADQQLQKSGGSSAVSGPSSRKG